MVEDEPAHVALVSRAFEKHTERFEVAVASSLKEAKQYLPPGARILFWLICFCQTARAATCCQVMPTERYFR